MEIIKCVKEPRKIVFCIFGCLHLCTSKTPTLSADLTDKGNSYHALEKCEGVTKERYKNEILKINETWGKQAEKRGLKILYFMGEKEVSEGFMDETKYIYLENVGDDYLSASKKQNLGLKYIYEHYNSQYIFCCGTDTYVNVENLVKYLDSLGEQNEPNNNTNLYIGGNGDYRMFDNEKLWFQSGGSGFIITNDVLEKLYPELCNIDEQWKKICNSTVDSSRDNKSNHDLISACDVSIAYFVKQNDTKTISNDNFYSCNYRGYADNYRYNCCVDKIKLKDIISCHNMSMSDFDEYTYLLELFSKCV